MFDVRTSTTQAQPIQKHFLFTFHTFELRTTKLSIFLLTLSTEHLSHPYECMYFATQLFSSDEMSRRIFSFYFKFEKDSLGKQ